MAETLKKERPGVVVAEIDCTTQEGAELCSQHDIQGFPTIKYSSSGLENLKDYQQGRSAEDFTNFALENIRMPCDASDESLCNKVEMAFLEGLKKLSKEELVGELKRLTTIHKQEEALSVRHRIRLLERLRNFVPEKMPDLSMERIQKVIKQVEAALGSLNGLLSDMEKVDNLEEAIKATPIKE